MNILFITSEAYPLIKTGGLADVAASLPRALLKRGHSVRLVLPAYRSIMEQCRSLGTPATSPEPVASEEEAADREKKPTLKALPPLTIDGQEVKLWQTRLPGTRVTVWLVDTKAFSERSGNPYVTAEGKDWPDNHRRFYDFCAAAVELAQGRAGIDWQADLVHGNDWQSGLAIALLAQERDRPATVFTIHNLAYHGLFSYQAFTDLPLPGSLWHPDALEFYDQLSFIKGGLVYADQITTVSPSYAEEIQTAEFGCGLDGLLRARAPALKGILNGINTQEWNPGSDPHLAQNYTRRTLKKKLLNKQALQQRLGLPEAEEVPLLGFIGRLVEQKGVDLLLKVLPEFFAQNQCQLVLLGNGAAAYHTELKKLQLAYPKQLALVLGYDENLAHQIEAGSDLFLMPSLFEPCGLNQLYSLRYGTLPLVHAVGGLKDTVFDSESTQSTNNGFAFSAATAEALPSALEDTLSRALALYHQPELWRERQLNAMQQDYSWDKSADEYEQVYQQALIVNQPSEEFKAQRG